MKNIHIGSVIKEKLEEKSMTITEFANRINRERTSVYDIFERKSVDTELLIQISEALDYDFVHEVYFPEYKNTTSSKIHITIEVEEGETEKLKLHVNELVRLLKLEK